MAAKRFWDNAEARGIAHKLIRSERELHNHSLLTIHHVFEDPPRPKLWASTSKMTAVDAALVFGLATERDAVNATPPTVFVIRYNWSAWEHQLDERQHEALVHHELHHIDPVAGAIVDHDVEEFVRTFKKYGAWYEGLGLFASKPVDPL